MYVSIICKYIMPPNGLLYMHLTINCFCIRNTSIPTVSSITQYGYDGNLGRHVNDNALCNKIYCPVLSCVVTDP